MARRSPDMLSRDELEFLESRGWGEYVGLRHGVWVPTAQQRLLLVRGEMVVRGYPCSTAAAGVGGEAGSWRTPTGWHEIGQKIGHGLLHGAVLVGRRWNGDVWTGQEKAEDCILSRILRLRGLEHGVNRGGKVDTWERMIMEPIMRSNSAGRRRMGASGYRAATWWSCSSMRGWAIACSSAILNPEP